MNLEFFDGRGKVKVLKMNLSNLIKAYENNAKNDY